MNTIVLSQLVSKWNVVYSLSVSYFLRNFDDSISVHLDETSEKFPMKNFQKIVLKNLR